MTAAVSEAKARQLSKIRELRLALRRAGLIGLDEQAQALGLPRSTTWKILKGGHKASGLSAMVVSRMLSEPRLPPVVRTKILEYVREKTDGTARENCLDSRLGFGTPNAVRDVAVSLRAELSRRWIAGADLRGGRPCRLAATTLLLAVTRESRLSGASCKG